MVDHVALSVLYCVVAPVSLPTVSAELLVFKSTNVAPTLVPVSCVNATEGAAAAARSSVKVNGTVASVAPLSSSWRICKFFTPSAWPAKFNCVPTPAVHVVPSRL